MTVVSTITPSDLPQSFVKYLNDNDIDTPYYISLLKHPTPRYIRTVPPHTTTIIDLRTAFDTNIAVHPTILPYVYQLTTSSDDTTTHININNTLPYKQHQIHGIDLASTLACTALLSHIIDTDDTIHVLDMCCAPGNKLLVLNDMLQHSCITGVDCSYTRLCTARALCRRYIPADNNNNKVRLCLADGTRFDTLSHAYTEHSNYNYIIDLTQDGDCATITAIDRKHLAKQTKQYSRKRSRQQIAVDDVEQTQAQLYDAILVDAECTHDGSLQHIRKYTNTSAGTAHVDQSVFETQFMSRDRLQALQTLQRALLMQAWRLLKVGGVVVYSTCSLMRAQNEHIVEWLMSECGDSAHIIGDPFAGSVVNNSNCESPPHAMAGKTIKSLQCQRERMSADQTGANKAPQVMYESTAIRDHSGHVLGHGIRFDPLLSDTSGLFVCKLQKTR